MEIRKPGKYKLLKTVGTRGSISVTTLKEGSVIEITQVSERTKKVIGPNFLDWMPWDLPVEAIS